MRSIRLFAAVFALFAAHLNAHGASPDTTTAGVDAKEKDVAATPEVWVTSIASGTITGADGPKSVHFAGTASGLLLRPADVVRWEGDNFAARTVVMSHPTAVWCVQISADGSHVASSDYKGNLQILDTATGQATMHEGVLERWTQTLRFAPQSDTIVAGNEAGKLFVWEGDKITKAMELDKNALTDMAFNATGDTLAVSDGGGQVHLLKWPSLESVTKLKICDGPAWCVQFNPSGTGVLVGTADRKLYFCEAKEGAKAEPWIDGSDWITRVALSPSGALAVTEVSGRVYVINANAKPSETVSPIGTAPSGVWTVCWPSADQLLVGTRKHGVQGLMQTWTFAKPAEPKSAEPKADEPKPAEQKPADAPEPAAEEKPAEEKPAEEKPAEAAAPAAAEAK